ncbi:TauD/TfdA family dioxygenase [Streptomyces sudanensis]|uniref:TauD/TfdA family dioxygenase n=1 Tax=Streptomyces sudanensis TaxID=436397 RepID=UPI0027E3EBF5|nr:TauD/TfdA family dioxygenase [Streptomyces sudanensis]
MDVSSAYPEATLEAAVPLGGPPSPAAIEKIAREHLENHGYLYLFDVPDDFDHLGFLRAFGEFVPQYDGQLVWDLKPEPDMDDVYHSRNTRSLVPHTEAYEYPGLPPRYLALWCVRPARGPGGETTLADGYAWLRTFSSEEREIMRTRRYEWTTSEGLVRRGVKWGNRHPILESRDGVDVLRYSANNVNVDGDDFLPGFLRSGTEFFEENCIGVRIARNCLLLWDNWRMLHSRTSFKDSGRHLRRVLISA